MGRNRSPFCSCFSSGGWKTPFSRGLSLYLQHSSGLEGEQGEQDPSGFFWCGFSAWQSRELWWKVKKSPEQGWKLGIAWRIFGAGRQGSLPGTEGTLAFLVSQGHGQIHRGVARICLRCQVGAASCKQAVEIRARCSPADVVSPLGQAQGKGTPKRRPSWLGSPPWHPRLLSFSPQACHALSPRRLPTSSDSRPRTQCRSSPLPSRASTHLT